MSTKRMKLHWKQDHGSLGLPTRDSDLARDAILQTFFRGNKVKYFEVESLYTADTGGTLSHDAAQLNFPDALNQSYIPKEQQSTIPSIEPHTNLSDTLGESDMWMLRYFHHFATTTSLTLPYSSASSLQERYWQDSIISKALQHSWLMHGLLAISACHMAVSVTDPGAKKLHCEYEAQYASKFHSRTRQSILDETVEHIGDHVRCLLHLAEIALHQVSPDRARNARQDRSIVMSLRGCLRPGSDIVTFPTCLGEEEATDNGDLTKGPLEGLQTLRTRMFELLGRPANIKDALTTLKSIELLQETCSSVGSEDSIESSWSAAAAWLKDVPRHFHDMADEQDPIALLTMIYWSAIMVARVEREGCWFLKGVVKASVLQITQRLVVDKHPLLPLVLDFGGDVQHCST